jgi:MFS family permease
MAAGKNSPAPVGQGFKLYSRNMVPLVLAGLIAVLPSGVILPLLDLAVPEGVPEPVAWIVTVATAVVIVLEFGPLLAGLVYVCLGRRAGEARGPGQVLRGFRWLWPSLALGLVPLALFVGYALVVIWQGTSGVAGGLMLLALPLLGVVYGFALLALVHVVDRGQGLAAALRAAFAALAQQPGRLLWWCFLAAVIGSLGALAFDVVKAVTLPMGACMLIEVHRLFHPAPEEEAEAEAGEEPAAEPGAEAGPEPKPAAPPPA